MDSRYYLHDYDEAEKIAYVFDTTDGFVYALTYSHSGDDIDINWESKKRMKVSYVEFNDGDSDEMSATFSHFNTKYQEVVDELQQFKLDMAHKADDEARNAIIATFEDLRDFEDFGELVNHASDYSPAALEEKCYALRGRHGMTMKFSSGKLPKIKIVKTEYTEEPYGGLFERYGFGNN
mgnify:CR=1 FL=1